MIMKNTLLKIKQTKQIIKNLHNKKDKVKILLYGVFNLAN